jgi:hypothetical protein
VQAKAIYLGDAYRPGDHLVGNPLVEHRGGVQVATWPWYEVPGALLVAQTGSGKTSLLRVATNELLKIDGDKVVILADGKGVGSFHLFVHVRGVRFLNDKQAIATMIGEVHGIVLERAAKLADAREQAAKTRRHARNWRPFTPIFVWIDEYIGWLLLLDDITRQTVVEQLGLISFQGREVGVRLLLAMQTCHAKTFDAGLSPQMKMNLTARIGVPGDKGFDATQARMLFDDATAKDRIPRVKGGGLFRIGDTEVAFTVPWLPDPTDPEANLTDKEVNELWSLVS